MARWRLRLGMAIALCVTATGLGAVGRGVAAGSHWVASWAASPSDASLTQPSLGNQTLRMIVAPHLGGSSLRIHLTNRFGKGPITLDHVAVALSSEGAAVVAGSSRPVTVAGASSITIPAGHDVVSDPVALTIKPFSALAISVYVAGEIDRPTEHRITRQTSYLSAPGSGDHTTDAGAGAFTATTAGLLSTGWYFLDGIDVRAGANVGTVVTLGDSITDGYEGDGDPSIENPTGIDANARYPDALARRLLAAKLPLTVVNAGIAGNRILAGGGTAGPSAIARLRDDVIDEAGVTDVIVLEGINDIGSGRASASHVESGLSRIVAALHRAHLRVWLGTITPAGGTKSKSPLYGDAAGNAVRGAVNAWIRRQHASDGVIDFDRALRDPSRPSRLLPAYDSSDHLHPNAAGYRAMAAAVDLRALVR